MTYRPARRLADIEPFHVVELLTRARQLEAEGRDIIHMEVGEPDFPTPEPIARAAVAAIQGGKTLYTQALGLPELRAAIADFYRERYGVAVSASRIAITNGASGALNLAFAALANPGDEWLLADPGYPCNRHFLRLVEGAAQLVPVGPESRYQLTPQLVERHWDGDSVGALVASPANPTGTLLHRDELAALASSLKQRGGHLVVDEIYHGLTYGCDAASVLEVDDDAFVLNSFSKYFGMTGWRLGWAILPDEPTVLEAVDDLATNYYLCAHTPTQHAALACFTPESLAECEARRQELLARRRIVIDGLKRIGLPVEVEPNGAFYAYFDISRTGLDAWTFCERALDEAHVALTPGRDFGAATADTHVRLSYAASREALTEGLERLGTFVESL